MNESPALQHFILTRFNLLLWKKDKEGDSVRTREWLEHRFWLFEKYCLPSVINQTCNRFEWIVLFDSSTPDYFKDKISVFQAKCPQLKPVFVQPEKGRLFAEIFRQEVLKRQIAPRVITTYLDNDDALNTRFVEDVQKRAGEVQTVTFFNYTHGYQFYTDYKYLLQVHYPRNHFVSVVENGTTSMVKTIYGFGSHYYIDRINNVKIERVENDPMWCEVIHERNMGNDAYFLLGTQMIGDRGLLRARFGINEDVESGTGVYLFRFLPRYIRTFFRRVKYFFFGRHW